MNFRLKCPILIALALFVPLSAVFMTIFITDAPAKLRQFDKDERRDNLLGKCIVAIGKAKPATSTRESPVDVMRDLLAREDELADLNVEIINNTRFRGTSSSEPLYGKYWVSSRGACFAMEYDEIVNVKGIVLSRQTSKLETKYYWHR